jgi:hypothetical protein
LGVLPVGVARRHVRSGSVTPDSEDEGMQIKFRGRGAQCGVRSR